MSDLLYAVLFWLETGAEADDQAFVATAADRTRALFGAWTDAEGPQQAMNRVNQRG